MGGIAGPLLMVAGFFIFFKLLSLFNVSFGPIASIIIALTPIWLPFTMFYLTFERWMWFVRLKFRIYNGRSTLRLQLPQEVFRSPEAMEGVLTQIHNVSSADNLMQTYIDGKHPLTFSLELVSIGGEVRFYINVPTKKTKDSVEAQLYAYYPGIEVSEEKLDYTAEIPWDPKRYEYMSFHMGKKKKPDEDFFPIKTYIDFGLDKIPKEEEKFEPMAAMIEQLGKIKPHERIWIQFLITPHTKKNINNGSSLKEIPTWDKRAIKYIEATLKRDKKVETDPETQERAPMLTAGERDAIAAIERNVGKYAYETAIRWMYITEKGKFNGDLISPTLRSFAAYDIVTRNSLGVQWRTDFNYNFISDYSGMRKEYLKKRELIDYKLREYNMDLATFSDKPQVLSVEELATLYHIPGSSVITPTLPRILSTRKEPPANLPTGLNKSL